MIKNANGRYCVWQKILVERFGAYQWQQLNNQSRLSVLLKPGTQSFRDFPRITVNPAVMTGKPCIRGTRITVYDILEYMAGGMSEPEILRDFPSLTSQDLKAVLAFAAARERRLATSPAA